jgi:hypothetical protein
VHNTVELCGSLRAPSSINWHRGLLFWIVGLPPALVVCVHYISRFLCSKPVAANVTSDFPTFQITINDTKPVWGYCGQTGHCQQGMVFGFNTPSYGNTFAAFQELAIESNATTSSTPSGSPSGSTDHHILVGPDGQLVYSPSNITAKPGDTVTFFFNPKNHTGMSKSLYSEYLS